MKHFAGWLKNLCGATAIEYSLIAAGIALTIAASVYAFGDRLVIYYDRIVAIF